MSSFIRNLVVWVVLGSLMVFVFNNVENSSAREQISYSEFKQDVLSDRVNSCMVDAFKKNPYTKPLNSY